MSFNRNTLVLLTTVVMALTIPNGGFGMEAPNCRRCMDPFLPGIKCEYSVMPIKIVCKQLLCAEDTGCCAYRQITYAAISGFPWDLAIDGQRCPCAGTTANLIEVAAFDPTSQCYGFDWGVGTTPPSRIIADPWVETVGGLCK